MVVMMTLTCLAQTGTVHVLTKKDGRINWHVPQACKGVVWVLSFVLSPWKKH